VRAETYLLLSGLNYLFNLFITEKPYALTSKVKEETSFGYFQLYFKNYHLAPES